MSPPTANANGEQTGRAGTRMGPMGMDGTYADGAGLALSGHSSDQADRSHRSSLGAAAPSTVAPAPPSGAGGMALEKQCGSFTQAYSVGNGLLRRGSEYPLFDGHGSERTVTNSSQTVTGSVNFEAFGQVAGSSGSSTSPYMYAGDWGYRNDGDAGLMHVGARYYDAQVGRFITRDTVLSEHPYLYCEHEPANFADDDGFSKKKVPPRRGGKGGSGDPKVHNIKYPSKGRAEQGARDRGYGKPIHHPPADGAPGHFHPTDPFGEKIDDGTHHIYPRIGMPSIDWPTVGIIVGGAVLVGGFIVVTGGAGAPALALIL